MKKLFVIFIYLAVYIPVPAQQKSVEEKLLPVPVSVTEGSGVFTLNDKTTIVIAAGNDDVKRVALQLSERIGPATGFRLPVSVSAATPGDNAIILSLIKDGLIGNEGYRLKVTPQHVLIEANRPAGLFYGMQTLAQLLPPQIESKQKVQNISWAVPACSVTDYPRFGWRGLMFDVARHFFTKEEVKQFIDNMVKYKYNLLHLHLTDDEGWRIEIKGLPKLTEVGAWNVKKVGYFGTFSPPAEDEPRDYGGFFTQDDIREIVKYAGEHFVNVMPEIDVPGHSLAAIASYPELSCTPGADKYHVRSGEVIMDWSHGHPPIALLDNTLCPANEKVYAFLDKVMTQVAQLFPFEYIHVGGDECPKNYWEKSDAIKALMKREKLKSMQEVQSYFEKRLEKIVESKGKKFLGWDEILEGGLAPSAAVMSWRGMAGGIQAAKMNHEVVMSPTDFAYLDYMQGDPVIEPRIYASLRLQKAYQFDPVPEGVDPKYIKGGQGNLWTEQIYNTRHLEYMLWPRAMAIAECVWSPKERKDWNGFVTRVEQQFENLDAAGTKYAPSMYDPAFRVTRTDSTHLQVELSTEVPGLDIYYSFDNSFPDQFYPKYTAPLVPPKDAVMLKVITYRGSKPVGRMIFMPVEELQKRAGIIKKQ